MMSKYDKYKESAFTHEEMQPMIIETDMTDVFDDLAKAFKAGHDAGRSEAADEIEQLREALSAMTELFKATEASAQWALSEVERRHHALECVVLYWDEWKDAPDDHPTALSLEEVVNICRPHLREKE